MRLFLACAFIVFVGVGVCYSNLEGSNYWLIGFATYVIADIIAG